MGIESSLTSIGIDTTKGLAGPDPSNTSSAGTSAISAAHMARQLISDISSQIVPFQGDMNQMIQNRPQVIMPQPTLRKMLPPDDNDVGKVEGATAYGRQRNDVMNIVHAISNVTKQHINQKREKENNQMMADMAIIQAAAANPNDPHNKAILDKMAQDPKTVNRLKKALGYNPLSGEPMPPETKTMVQFGAQQQQKQQRAQQLAQAVQQRTGQTQQGDARNNPMEIPSNVGQGGGGGGVMGGLLSRAPNTPQVNPVVQVQGELIKAGIMPKADVSLQAFATLTKDLMTNHEKYDEFKAKVEATNNRTLMEYQKSIDAARNRLDLEKIRQTGAGQRSTERAGAQVKSAQIRAAATIQAAKIRQQNSAKLQEMRTKHQLLVKETEQLDKDIKNAQVDRAAVLQSGKKVDSAEYKAADKEIQRLNNLKGKNEELMKMYDDHEGRLKESVKTPTTQLLDDEPGGPDDDPDEKIF